MKLIQTVCVIGLLLFLPLSCGPADSDGAVLHSQVRELLGPMAFVAVSPFYGVALLSGAALLTREGYIEGNSFLRENIFLKHEATFAVFLALSLLISAFRLGKLANTIGTHLAYIEDRAALVFIVLMQLAGENSDWREALWNLGWGFLDLWSVLILAMHYFVIMKVRFWLDVLVFVSPLPFVDAALEAGKKFFATVLTAIYVASPGLSAVISVGLFVVSLFIFLRMLRLAPFYSSVYVEPLFWRLRRLLFAGDWPRVSPDGPRALRRKEPLFLAPVFNRRAASLWAMPAKTRLWLAVGEEGGGESALYRFRWFRGPLRVPLSAWPERELGREVVLLSLRLSGPESPELELVASRLYGEFYGELLEALPAADAGPTRAERLSRRLRDGFRRAEA